MRANEPIEELIANLKARPSTDLDARVHRGIDAAQAARSGTRHTSQIRTLGELIMKTRSTKWAAAAAMVVILIAAVAVLDKSAPRAFGLERVIAAFNTVRSLHVKDFKGDQQEPNEFWIVSDGQGHVVKARYNLPETEDGPKLITWTSQGSEIWFKQKRRYLTYQTKRIAPWMQQLLDLSQPEVGLKKVLEERKAGKVTIDTETIGGAQPAVKFTASYKTKPKKDVVFVDPKTDLVTRLEFYKVENGADVLQGRMEFSDYNATFDDKLFSLRGELPKDVRIADQLHQVCGVAQGSLTDEQAAAETVRQFFQALVDKDYKKAGLIVCGEMEDDAKAEYGKLTVAAIVSVEPAEPQPKWVKRGYKVPCELKVVHPDGRQSTWTPGVYVRPGDDEMHPDHWNITGGVNLHEADLRMLPDNAKYEKMSPKEAAAAFFKACAEKNWDEFLKFYPMPEDTNRVERMKEGLGGLQLISLGEPYQTNNYDGWFVPYEIKLPSQDYVVRVDNTNQGHRYVLTGIYDTQLQLQHELKWMSEPPLLPDNARYAAMSPASVVKAATEAQAAFDLDELAKFVPPEQVQQVKRSLENAQKRGIELPKKNEAEVGEAFWSAEHSACFVKCHYVPPVKKWNLAIRNDNPTHRYLFDGGL